MRDRRALLQHRRRQRRQRGGVGRGVQFRVNLRRPAVVDRRAAGEHEDRRDERIHHRDIAAAVLQQAIKTECRHGRGPTSCRGLQVCVRPHAPSETVAIKQQAGLCSSNGFRAICGNAKVSVSGTAAFLAYRRINSGHALAAWAPSQMRQPIFRMLFQPVKSHGFRGFSHPRILKRPQRIFRGFTKVAELGAVYGCTPLRGVTASAIREVTFTSRAAAAMRQPRQGHAAWPPHNRSCHVFDGAPLRASSIPTGAIRVGFRCSAAS